MSSFAGLMVTADALVRQALGQSVNYYPTVGSPVTVHGIFDASYVKLENAQAGVSSTGPAVFLALADLPSDPSTDITATIAVGLLTYRVRECEPDGLGGVLLYLTRTN